MATYTDRQQEIAAAAAKRLGVPADAITGINLDANGIPSSINFSTDAANFTRDIVPLYGDVLNQSEKNALTQARLEQNTQDSQNGYSGLLGKNKKPFVSSSSNERAIIENLANPTFDPSTLRRTSAGLPPGAQRSGGSNGEPLVKFVAPKGEDTRVRIVVPTGPLTSKLTTGPVLSPLAPTNGVLFPYTPSIQVTHGATYNSENLTHSNYAYQFYQSSNVDTINITATFACKNSADAAYVIAVQHFFRTVTKMFYGQDAEAGLPPPVLRLEGHGDYQFGAHREQVGGVPVVITSFSINLPEDVDYITANINRTANTESFRAAESNPFAAGSLDNGVESQTRVPIVQQFSISCITVYSRKSITGDFGFDKFAKGQLLATSTRGGFI